MSDTLETVVNNQAQAGEAETPAKAGAWTEEEKVCLPIFFFISLLLMKNTVRPAPSDHQATGRWQSVRQA